MDTMTFKEYQELTKQTAIYGQSISEIADVGSPAYNMLCAAYVGLGMGEAGETQGKIKKLIRDSKGVVTNEHRSAIKKELGDQMWYIAQTATVFGLDLGDVAKGNIEKLFGRRDRGTLTGSGDER